MRRSLCLVLALSMCVIACDKQEPETPPAPPEAPTEVAIAPPDTRAPDASLERGGETEQSAVGDTAPAVQRGSRFDTGGKDGGPPSPTAPTSSTSTHPAPPPAPSPSAPSDPAAASIPQQELAMAFSLPRMIASNIHSSRSMVVEAVTQATISSGAQGSITSTGTLTVTDQAVTYAPTPGDRLVVHMANETHEFTIHDAQGDPQAATADAWLHSPHTLQYTHVLKNIGTARINAQYDGRTFTVRAEGDSLYNAQRIRFTLTAQGRSDGERDYHGQDVTTEYDLTGVITTDTFRIDVNEHHRSRFVSATNLRLLPSQRGAASRFNGVMNNTLNVGGAVYSFRNVQGQTDMATRRGIDAPMLTALEGEVLLNTRPWGVCAAIKGRPVLVISGGDTHIPLNAPPALPATPPAAEPPHISDPP